MPRINVLDKAVAELIAAGEVVERPASIVKELLENSIDAGADAVTVEIRGGGIQMIRVSDNGCGIAAEDIPKAFLRHATSKVKEAGDLNEILTLGFRGEALASIAAMAKVELTTRSAGDNEGTTYVIEGGKYVDSSPAGCPVGTVITVSDVFYNTPARMKFLKRDIGEGNAVAQVVDKCALSHPGVAFRFLRDGQTKLHTSGGGNLLAVVKAIYGGELSGRMLPVDYFMDGAVHVTGYVAAPSAARPSRSYQNFFINGRYVRTRTCSAALEEAFKGKIMSGRFPACVLNLEITAQSVDVNVHPAKIEVRFADERPVYSAVYYAVKSALGSTETPLAAQVEEKPAGKPPINELTLRLPQDEYRQQRLTVREYRALQDKKYAEEAREAAHLEPVRFGASSLDIFVDDEKPAAPRREPIKRVAAEYDKKTTGVQGTILQSDAQKPFAIPTEYMEHSEVPTGIAREQEQVGESPYRLIGELFGAYILLEQGSELVLVDKHAAHERMRYERLMENISYGNRQVLLSPLTVTLARDEYDAVVENLAEVERMGFGAEDFGDGAVLVREVPIELGDEDVAGILCEIAGRLLKGAKDLTPETLDRLYYSIACKSALRAGDKSSHEELDELVRKLERNPQITHCPHGRPVSVRMGKRQIEKLFGRIV